MEESVLTAQDFLDKYLIVTNAMTEFAKYHVDRALKAASEEAEVDGFCESGDNHCVVDKSSILGAYEGFIF